LPLNLIARFFDMRNPTPTDLSCQLGAVSAGCHADLAAEDLGQMALVGEASLLRNPGEGLMGVAQQAFGALYPALDDIALRPNPGSERLK
jgi:hypothetical protein